MPILGRLEIMAIPGSLPCHFVARGSSPFLVKSNAPGSSGEAKGFKLEGLVAWGLQGGATYTISSAGYEGH